METIQGRVCDSGVQTCMNTVLKSRACSYAAKSDQIAAFSPGFCGSLIADIGTTEVGNVRALEQSLPSS